MEYTYTITVDLDPEPVHFNVPADTEHEALARVRDYLADALASIEHQLGDRETPAPAAYGREHAVQWLGFPPTSATKAAR